MVGSLLGLALHGSWEARRAFVLGGVGPQRLVEFLNLKNRGVKDHQRNGKTRVLPELTSAHLAIRHFSANLASFSGHHAHLPHQHRVTNSVTDLLSVPAPFQWFFRQIFGGEASYDGAPLATGDLASAGLCGIPAAERELILAISSCVFR